MTEEEKPIFEKYFLINSSKSKYLALFKFLFLIAILIELILLPYTVCYGIDYVYITYTSNVEYTIDIIWVINIILTFFVSLENDGVVINKPKSIMVAYLKDNFFFDLCSTMPTLGILIWKEHLCYWAKFLRLKRITTLKKLID